ncbi:MAG: penicillin-binding protein 2 [bacterium]|nr:penicillin-binding protein 2 [bacterium]
MTTLLRDHYRIKAYLILLFFVFGYALVVYRLYRLQILEHAELREKAEKQHKRTVTIVPKRGTIYDRKGREIAISVDTISLYAVPPQIEDKPAVAKAIAKMTGQNRRKVLQSLLKKKQFVWIARKLNPAILAKLESSGLEGVHALYESKRFYPHRTLAAGLLGIVGMDNEGLEGLEYNYDAYIKGRPGLFVASVDAKRRNIMMDGEGYVKPSGANNLVLTIDNVIQHITEVELKGAVEQYKAESGMAVMMRPYTGEILAMASYPGFDPNDFGAYRPQDRRNRPIQENFEPGSTFKLITLAAALDAGVVKPKDIFFCENGAYRFRTTVYHDTHEYGWLTVRQILQRSSNIGAIKIAERLTNNNFYRYIRHFGFGQETGIDLPGESKGILRSTKRWSGLSRASLSMGQEISVTALQVLTAAAAIANKGVRLQPHVVSRVMSPEGRTILERRPKVVTQIVSESTAALMMRAMESVVDKEKGTAPLAQVPGFRVAGKTGTAQKFDVKLGSYSTTKYVSSFVGVVPADDPEIALIVIVNEPRGQLYYGGYVAAPAFRRIAERTLRYLKVFPENTPELRLTLGEGNEAPISAIKGSG